MVGGPLGDRRVRCGRAITGGAADSGRCIERSEPHWSRRGGSGRRLAARIARVFRKPFAALARRLGGVDVELEKYELESRRLARDHELQACVELDECVNRVEQIGVNIDRGLPSTHPDAIEYAARKHRLRDLDPRLPALCDATMRAISSPPEWQQIAQIARPAIAARRAAALSTKRTQ